MAKISVNLAEPDASPQVDKLRELAAPLPSVSKAKSQSLKSAPRVQLSFTNVPKPIKDEFVAQAERRGLSMKEYLYECLRAGGVSIPDTSDIDARTR